MVRDFPGMLLRLAVSLTASVIVAGENTQAVLHSLDDGDLARWLLSVAPLVRRVASVCTEAFALGRAGLLTGCRAITLAS